MLTRLHSSAESRINWLFFCFQPYSYLLDSPSSVSHSVTCQQCLSHSEHKFYPQEHFLTVLAQEYNIVRCIPWKYSSGLNSNIKQQLRRNSCTTSLCLSKIFYILIKLATRPWIWVWNASCVWRCVSAAKSSWKLHGNFLLYWFLFLFFFFFFCVLASLKQSWEMLVFFFTQLNCASLVAWVGMEKSKTTLTDILAWDLRTYLDFSNPLGYY